MTKLIYVAGPYRAHTAEGVARNIRTAQQVGALLADLGYFPVVPHSLSAGIEQSDSYWLRHTMAVMERCDAVVLCPGWPTSEGTRAEVERAKALGLPVYSEISDVPVMEDAA